MEAIADGLLNDDGIQATLYGVSDWGQSKGTKKDLTKDLNAMFDNIAYDSPQKLIDLMHNILDKLECSNAKEKKLKGIYNLKQRLDRFQPEQIITVEDFYQNCMQTECNRDTPFEHPNGWIMWVKPRDMMYYGKQVPYSATDDIVDANMEYGNTKNIRFYIEHTSGEYPPDYFRENGQFWITSGLEYVDFDDCMFNQLEKVFEWL
jgi:hypothetical protein